jgi:hypothetical protein
LLPANQLKTGDIVTLKPYQKEPSKNVPKHNPTYQLIRAVVFRLTESRITLSVDTEPVEDILGGTLPVTM